MKLGRINMSFADANPGKRFFIELITRDITLEDSILDLIDNSIDSLMRTKKITAYKEELLKEEQNSSRSKPAIRINFTFNKFRISDNCGGITFNSAKKDVFRFGSIDKKEGESLSVFGIGMKRAIFKIGRQITIESHSANSGFSMNLDVKKWLKDTKPDWKFPITEETGRTDSSKAGTEIVITQLSQEVKTVYSDPAFESRLTEIIEETYPFFLGKSIKIFVQDKELKGQEFPFAQSETFKPTIETWVDGQVKATLICGLLPRETGSVWTYEKSGWYLVCNGRVIVAADKTRLTGWGAGIMPQFMPKNRGFLGVVFFNSDDPEELPWKTTKRGINSESVFFMRTLKKMGTTSRAVIQLQNKMYSSNDDDEPRKEYRDAVSVLQSHSATETAARRGLSNDKPPTQFFSFPPTPSLPKIITIRFDVKAEEFERVKKRLGVSRISRKKAGEKVFQYYLDRECPL